MIRNRFYFRRMLGYPFIHSNGIRGMFLQGTLIQGYSITTKIKRIILSSYLARCLA